MKVGDLMTKQVISVDPEETVEFAARTLAHYNVGILPVCHRDGKLCGLVTDRDLVTRCMASGRQPSQTRIREVMSTRLTAVTPDTGIAAAAELMGSQQVRRLPVVEQGKLRGMLSLGDLSRNRENAEKAALVLQEISRNPAGKQR